MTNSDAGARVSVDDRRRGTGLKTAKQRRTASLLISLLPGLVVLAVFFLIPLLRLAEVSLQDDFLADEATLTLANYVRFFTTSSTTAALLTSMRLSLVVTVVTLFVGYPVAHFLVWSESRLKPLVFIAIISPLLISLVVRSLGWLIVLGRAGALNRLMLWFGVIDEPIQLIYTFGAVVVGTVHVLLPFMVLSIASVLNQVPRAVEEAADILGAKPWQRFLRVTLPLSLPGVISGSFLVFALTMGSYITPQMLGGGQVRVLTLSIYDRMVVVFDWGYGSAMAVVLLVVTLSLALYIGRLQRRFGVPLGGGGA